MKFRLYLERTKITDKQLSDMPRYLVGHLNPLRRAFKIKPQPTLDDSPSTRGETDPDA